VGDFSEAGSKVGNLTDNSLGIFTLLAEPDSAEV
jgi:hypothetical protein